MKENQYLLGHQNTVYSIGVLMAPDQVNVNGIIMIPTFMLS